MPYSERKKRIRTMRHKAFTTWPKVSKNAFVEPIQALQNYYTKNLKDLSQNQNNTCIFAVRGFIDSLKPYCNAAYFFTTRILHEKSSKNFIQDSYSSFFFSRIKVWVCVPSYLFCRRYMNCRLTLYLLAAFVTPFFSEYSIIAWRRRVICVTVFMADLLYLLLLLFLAI